MEIHFELCMTRRAMILLRDRRWCTTHHVWRWHVRIYLIHNFKIECDFRRMKNHTALPSSLFTQKKSNRVSPLKLFCFVFDMILIQRKSILCKTEFSMLLSADSI